MTGRARQGGQALAVPTEPSSTVSALSGFDPSREMVDGVNEWVCRAAKLGAAQRRIILALGADWGPSPDHQATKRMWHGITGRGVKRQRGPLYVVEHKHRTDNCWRLNDNGLRLQVALWAAIATEARRAETTGSACEGAGLKGIAQKDGA